MLRPGYYNYNNERSSVSNINSNINSITVEVVAEVEKELDLYDIRSLVFLLYEGPDLALQNLTIQQRAKDLNGFESNLLNKWAVSSNRRQSWKYEILEALAICQLYGVIRKLGFNVESVIEHFSPEDLHKHNNISLIKKVLYKLCENITADNLLKLKKTLQTYNIDTMEYEAAEQIILKLISVKFIIVDEVTDQCEIEKLAKIISFFPELTKFSTALTEVQQELRKKSVAIPSSSTPENQNPESHNVSDEKIFRMDNFTRNIEVLEALIDEPYFQEHLKSDAKRNDGSYVIKNPKRVGVCCIFNMENFHPSFTSINDATNKQNLDDREGSSKDKELFKNLMTTLNFSVVTFDNRTKAELFQELQNVIAKLVCQEDSVFMLCLLSHGIRGHIYAADSVAVSVDQIQNFMDSKPAENIHAIPKVLVIQACQVDNTPTLVADSPRHDIIMKKSNFLTYWATAPDLEAYRDTKLGSIFISELCEVLEEHVEKEHLVDIFTLVNNNVAEKCHKLKKEQHPIIQTTLRGKLYLKQSTRN